MQSKSLSRRHLAVGVAWSVPVVATSLAAPAFAASPLPCPPLTNAAGCDWNFNYNGTSQAAAQAYYTRSADSFTYNLSFKATTLNDPASISYTYVLTYPKGKGPSFTVDPENPLLNGVGVGGTYASYTPSATVSSETSVSAPSGYNTSVTWVQRTIVLTFTRIGSVGSTICAGMNLDNWTLGSTPATGSEAQVVAKTTTNPTCFDTPSSTEAYKFTDENTSQSASPYNADINTNSNDAIWT